MNKLGRCLKTPNRPARGKASSPASRAFQGGKVVGGLGSDEWPPGTEPAPGAIPIPPRSVGCTPRRFGIRAVPPHTPPTRDGVTSTWADTSTTQTNSVARGLHVGAEISRQTAAVRGSRRIPPGLSLGLGGVLSRPVGYRHRGEPASEFMTLGTAPNGPVPRISGVESGVGIGAGDGCCASLASSCRAQ